MKFDRAIKNGNPSKYAFTSTLKWRLKQVLLIIENTNNKFNCQGVDNL
jgi:hypothetical protein